MVRFVALLCLLMVPSCCMADDTILIFPMPQSVDVNDPRAVLEWRKCTLMWQSAFEMGEQLCLQEELDTASGCYEIINGVLLSYTQKPDYDPMIREEMTMVRNYWFNERFRIQARISVIVSNRYRIFLELDRVQAQLDAM